MPVTEDSDSMGDNRHDGCAACEPRVSSILTRTVGSDTVNGMLAVAMDFGLHPIELRSMPVHPAGAGGVKFMVNSPEPAFGAKKVNTPVTGAALGCTVIGTAVVSLVSTRP
jgi:hypothetical protein